VRDAFVYFVFLALLPVQWWISRAFARSAARRWKGWKLAAAGSAVYAFGAAAVAGYFFSCLPVFLPASLNGPAAGLLCGAAAGYAPCAVFAAVVYFAVARLRRHLDAETDRGRRRALHAAGAIAMAGPFAVVGYGALVERTNFRVRELDLPVAGLPHDLDGLRLLHLSDIHLSAFLTESEFARVIDASNGLRPHLAFVTGDLITGRGDPLDACIRQIARLKADAGVFGCMGNHERFAGAENYIVRAAAASGVDFLRGRSRQLSFGASVLNVAGVDYQSFHDKREYLRAAGPLRVHGAFNLLLSHNPDTFPAAARQGWNLQLSGHTHGGQVNVEIFDRSIGPATFTTPYVYGFFRTGLSAAYVTRGIGTLGVPARIGAPPEIALLRLRKA